MNNKEYVLDLLEKEEFKFFFFGCWNKGCYSNNPTDQIINKIRINDYDFGIVDGDNIYPIKTKKINIKSKIFNIKDFNSGFDCLNKLDKKVFLTIGNHDIENCYLLCRQQLYKNIILPHNFYKLTVFYNNKKSCAVILFLDTNLMDPQINEFKMNIEINKLEEDNYCKKSVDIQELKKCYNEQKFTFDNSKQIQWIEEEITNYNALNINKQLFIVGHFPIVTFKHKKTNKFMIDNSLAFLSNLHINTLNYYYLAADTHNYQLYKFKNGYQVISGTGGADLDDIELNNIENYHLIEKLNFELIEATKSYGYTEFNIINNKVEFKFVPINPLISMIKFNKGNIVNYGGYYYKYLKYKQKYNNLKHTLNNI